MLANVTAHAVQVVTFEQAGVAGRGAPFKPGTWRMTADAELPDTFYVLVRDRERCTENRISRGLGHHAALPGEERIRDAIRRPRMTLIAMSDIAKFEIVFVRLGSRLHELCRRSDDNENVGGE
jgi:hypothetical protein